MLYVKVVYTTIQVNKLTTSCRLLPTTSRLQLAGSLYADLFIEASHIDSTTELANIKSWPESTFPMQQLSIFMWKFKPNSLSLCSCYLCRFTNAHGRAVAQYSRQNPTPYPISGMYISGKFTPSRTLWLYSSSCNVIFMPRLTHSRDM